MVFVDVWCSLVIVCLVFDVVCCCSLFVVVVCCCMKFVVPCFMIADARCC